MKVSGNVPVTRTRPSCRELSTAHVVDDLRTIEAVLLYEWKSTIDGSSRRTVSAAQAPAHWDHQRRR